MKFAGRRPQPLVPDAEAIRALACLLSETGLTEIEYAIGAHRIRVVRVGPNYPLPADERVVTNADLKERAAADGHPPVSANLRAPIEAPPMASPSDHPGMLSSPIVGIAYIARNPDASPFVQVGDIVDEGQTVLIIEAMKVMNEIRAPRRGRVTRIFIQDAAPVEYGAPLLLIE